MTKNAHVSSTADVMPSVRAASSDLSFPDARCFATPDNEHASRWRHITCLLGAFACYSDKVAEPVRLCLLSSCGRALDDGYGHNATIEVLDRPSAASVILSWRDPTRCSYRYQSWQKRTAKQMGICAVSGEPIRRGDAVYRPARSGSTPSNASAMILAVYIDCPQLAPRRPSRE